MTKADIVAQIAAKTGLATNEVKSVVECTMTTISMSMLKGKNVYLRGFGSFVVKKRASKVARNISKNTSITLPERNVPTFKPCKEFITAVKEGVKTR